MPNDISSREFQKWLQQKDHLRNLLEEQPQRKKKIVKHLDKMTQGAPSDIKRDRIGELRNVEGVGGRFWLSEEMGGWMVGKDVELGRGGTYSWERRSEDVGVSGLSVLSGSGGDGGERREWNNSGVRSVIWERSDSGGSGVPLVRDEENLGEKNPITENVRETRSRDIEATENRKNEIMARVSQGEKLSKDEKKVMNKEIKARMAAADLEMKRLVPVACKYPKLLALLTFLGFFIGSLVVFASAIVQLHAAACDKKDAPDDVKREVKSLRIMFEFFTLAGYFMIAAWGVVVNKGLLRPLAKRITNMYEERCNLSTAELVALGCEGLEDRLERSAEENEEMGGSMEAAAFRRAIRTLVPLAILEIGFIVGLLIISLIILLAA